MSEELQSTVPYEPPPYVPHAGTVKVSGQTIPRRASACAVHFMVRGQLPIDFLCIGGNAGQQATKAMCLFVYKAKEMYDMNVVFLPRVFTTQTTNPATQEVETKRCTVWRTIILSQPLKLD